MRILFYLGWALIALAFASAAAEVLPRIQTGVGGSYVSAYDLWRSTWPDGFVATRAAVARGFDPWLWDTVILSTLALPAWLLFGAPGILLAWFQRPNRLLTDEQREELEKHSEAMFLFDELARQAKEDGFGGDEDDRLPDHENGDIFDTDGVTTPVSDEAYLNEITGGPGGGDIGGDDALKGFDDADALDAPGTPDAAGDGEER